MKKRAFAIFTLYVWLETLYGLVFHPYKETRKIIRHPILLPILFTPFLGIAFLFICGRIGAVLISVYGIKRELISLFLSATLLSILFWQIFLIYFLLSLISAKRRLD